METKLVTWDPEGVAAWAEVAPSEGAVLMHSLRGFIDAGRTGRLVAEHLVEEGDPVRIATFDIDELLDYRSRRPEMTFSVNEWTSYDEPYLALDMVRDAEDHPFLLLHGFEPDIRWEAYIRAVRDMVQRLGVGLVMGTHGIPMAVPHTRPLNVTVHGTSQDLLPDQPSMFGTVAVPASAQNLLEYRFGQWDIDAVNVAVHVPHYLAQSSYPQAAQRALKGLEDLSGLALDPDALDAEAERASEEIARQLAESEEVQALVTALEEQYDAFQESRDDQMLREGMLPSADELGEEFEKYLRQHGPDYPQG
ncbi:proteasome assembly chaperone family protein [Demequina capsici]|uniref:PAC2 family protein n=1 Tax=Demequina capsici TaxID=3075620 RepID=A0AA96F591_9MICO|nr:PAC2 family protein [Demequina sp. OYTSA14]WNM23363.1 PAC2 family protein [Demequina sp. OYTSA14]